MSRHQPTHAAQAIGLASAQFKYTPAVRTDVAKTWARFGWHPANTTLQSLKREALNG